MYTISFIDAEQALRAAEAAVSIAEGHGCLCGAFCTLPQFSSQSWLQELLPDPADEHHLVNEHAVDATLLKLHNETRLALQGDAMEFAPLLPDDEAPLAERIAALAQWSQGFLYGFGIGAPGVAAETYPGEVAEVLKDFSEIARANDTEVSGDDDEEEQAYFELVEYLRAAVQLIYDELVDQRAERAQQSHGSH
jgi:yecA family protein